MAAIALITDFGAEDWFAGELRGAILSLNPAVATIDLTHAIPRGGVREGAFALLASYRNFPEDTVFLASVGYADARSRVIAARTASHTFIAPDNGLLSWMLRREEAAEVREVNIEEYLLPSGCATFPARDLLAPLAAEFSDWLDFENCGEATSEYVKLDWPEALIDNGVMASAAVVYIDRFGNAVTSITPRELSDACGESAACAVGDRVIMPVGAHYGDVPSGVAVAYPGSAGLIEIGVNGGSAAELLALAVGSVVRFTPHSAQ